MKRQNLIIMGIEEEETQVHRNIFNKIVGENFPNPKMPIKVKEAYRIPNRLDKKRKPLGTL